jgi:hypothetical protein
VGLYGEQNILYIRHQPYFILQHADGGSFGNLQLRGNSAFRVGIIRKRNIPAPVPARVGSDSCRDLGDYPDILRGSRQFFVVIGRFALDEAHKLNFRLFNQQPPGVFGGGISKSVVGRYHRLPGDIQSGCNQDRKHHRRGNTDNEHMCPEFLIQRFFFQSDMPP